jgi:hypothetical protein
MTDKTIENISEKELSDILSQRYGIHSFQGFPTSTAYPKGPKYITIYNGNVKEEGAIGTHCGQDIPVDTLVEATLNTINDIWIQYNKGTVYIRCPLDIIDYSATYLNYGSINAVDRSFFYCPNSRVARVRVAFEQGDIV